MRRAIQVTEVISNPRYKGGQGGSHAKKKKDKFWSPKTLGKKHTLMVGLFSQLTLGFIFVMLYLQPTV